MQLNYLLKKKILNIDSNESENDDKSLSDDKIFVFKYDII